MALVPSLSLHFTQALPPPQNTHTDIHNQPTCIAGLSGGGVAASAFRTHHTPLKHD